MKGKRLSTRQLLRKLDDDLVDEVLSKDKVDFRHVDDVAYTTDQAPGALRNGTIVEKISTEPGEAHKNGDRAVIIGSLPEVPGLGRGYFVAWNDEPDVPMFVLSTRIRKVQPFWSS